VCAAFPFIRMRHGFNAVSRFLYMVLALEVVSVSLTA